MFSSRIAQPLEENELSRALRERRAAGLPLLDLTGSNPTQAGIAFPEAELLRALAQPGALAYQPEPMGLPSAREAVARYFLESRGAQVDPARILLTASTSEAYSLLFKLLCDPGDCVLVPAPSYPLFELLASLESVRTAAYPLRWDGEWHLDFAALEALLEQEPRARALLVVSPGNPTGAYLKRDEHARLVQLCAAKQLALICDEVFADYSLASKPSPRALPTAAVAAAVGAMGADDSLASQASGASEPALTFTLSGLSKVCALPQLKLGWCAVTGPAQLVQPALQRLELIADTYLSVATPIQLALPALLELRHGIQAGIRERCATNRRALLAARPIDASWDVLPAEAGWSALVRLPDSRGEEETALGLLARGVLVQPGYFYEFPRGNFLVLSLLGDEREMADALVILAATLAV